MESWIRVRTRTDVSTEPTFEVSEFLGTIPDSEGMQEIGCLKYAYDQDDVITSHCESFQNRSDSDVTGVCVNWPLTKSEIDDILEDASVTLLTHQFSEDGYDLTGSVYPTVNSETKWRHLINMLSEAKQIMVEDPDAKVYYCMWY
jgi:hypothetical protein